MFQAVAATVVSSLLRGEPSALVLAIGGLMESFKARLLAVTPDWVP
jgi:hypothetical protein